jgi:UDP-2,3-diacylglucosamine pyrophosphatase LpxH
MAMTEMPAYRTMFLSDIHLGSPGCQAELLLDFLKEHDAETIYLIGDIVDGWQLRRKWHWPQAHNDVVQKLLRKARKGARVIYLPGNHDEFLRDFPGLHFGGVEVRDSAIHETADGRKLVVIHGDQFDMVVRHARWLALLGDQAYETAMFCNHYVNAARRMLGLRYWSLSRWAKLRVKKAVSFIGAYEAAVADHAQKRGAHGVVCGHIHHPAAERRAGIEYYNTGDWVESCTAIVEHGDGRMQLIDWSAIANARRAAGTMAIVRSSGQAAKAA